MKDEDVSVANGAGGFLIKASGQQATWIIRGLGTLVFAYVFGRAFFPQFVGFDAYQAQISPAEYDQLHDSVELLLKELHAARGDVDQNNEIVETLLRSIKEDCLEDEKLRSWPARADYQQPSATQALYEFVESRGAGDG